MARTLFSLAVAIGLFLVGDLNAAAAAAPPAEEACSAAKAIFDDVTNHASDGRTVLDGSLDSGQIKLWSGPEGYDLAQTIPPLDGEAIEPQRWFTNTADGDVDPTRPAPPAMATVQAFLAADLVSASSCEVVRQVAIARGVDLKAPPGARKINRRTGRYAYSSIRLSVPVLSPDGTEALAYADSSSGPLGAGGALWLLRRDSNGAWKIAARLGLWVS